MLLHKLTNDQKIAESISRCVFRYYELIKYKNIEDNYGRTDASEGSITSHDSEISSHHAKMPIGSFDGIEFHISKMSFDDDYLRQYFVFCLSTDDSTDVMGDCNYVVDIESDIFECIEILLPTPDCREKSEGYKLFSHGLVEYYDIHNHTHTESQRWRDAYLKHSTFAFQREYRSSLFVSDTFFERSRKQPLTYQRRIRSLSGQYYSFPIKINIRSGIDSFGWRYIEVDMSEFQKNFSSSTLTIRKLKPDIDSMTK